MPDHRATSVPPTSPRERAVDGVGGPELARLLGHLQATVPRYVAGRRADGVPIERVLPEVRCIAREAESAEGGPSARPRRSWGRSCAGS